METKADKRPQRKAGAPFLMPDGRPLGLFLVENNLVQPERGGGKKGKRRPGAIKAAKEGWTSGRAGAATARATSAAAAVHSEAEAMELDALARVGHRRRRRWLNDKLLRDMAGTLTARDMEALFKPVPFGETGYVSPLAQALQPENIRVWDLFRSVDMDKESRVLQKWEAHVRSLQQGPHAIRNPAVDALAAWSSVSWKARKAMKRANPAHVEEIEMQLLAFMGMQGAEAAEGSSSAGVGPCQAPPQELVLELEDGFHRLIGHGLAEFHGLQSHSRAGPDGVKRLVLRRKRSAAAAPAAPLAITCSDVLMMLEDAPQHALNTHVLYEAYCHSHDTSSEAGGPTTTSPQPQPMLVAAQ